MNPTFNLDVFGHPTLRDLSGKTIPLDTRHQAGILTYLVMEAAGQPVRRATIAEMFWPDSGEDRARHSLSQALSSLRKHLGPEAIRSRDGTIELGVEIATELDRNGDGGIDSFDDLAEPLLGFEDIGGVSLSHWLDAARVALHERLRSRLLGELNGLKDSGEMRSLRRKAEQLYRSDPMSDDAVIVLAEDLLMDGDQTGALALLRAHAMRIKRACGGQPVKKVVELLRRLEMEDTQILKVMQPVVIMVGRDEEMTALEGAWNTIRDGGSMSVLVTGNPGIGKTTLVEKFTESVGRRQWLVYPVRCHEMGRRIPFSSIADLIHQLTEAPEVAGTDPAMLAEACRVAPALKTVYPGIPEPPRAEPDSIRVRVAAALFSMFHEVTEGRPTLISFDDIHNMDQASRDVLYVLYHRMRRQAAMFLCTARSLDVGKVVSRDDIMPWGKVVELKPLDREISRLLLKGVAADLPDDIAERVLQLGQDNPHLIEILVSDYLENGEDALVCASDSASGWQWQASETMKRALAGLLYGLTADAQRVLDLIAIVERPIDIGETVAISGIDEPAANAAGLELLERGLVRFDGEALVMKNELHRLYVRSRMNPDIRRFIHARLAKHVASTTVEETFSTTLEEAHHLLGADSVDRAVDKVAGGAKEALDRGAPREAEQAIMAAGRSVEVRNHQNLRLLLAKSLVCQGEFDAAATMLRAIQAENETDHTGDVELFLAESLLRKQGGDLSEVMELAKLAFQAARDSGDGLRMASALQVLTEAAAVVGNDQLATESARQSADLARTTNSQETRGKANLTLGYHSMMRGDPNATVRFFEDARNNLEGLVWDPALRRVMNGLGIAYTGTGQYEKAKQALLATIKISEEIGETGGYEVAHGNLGYLLMEQGYFREARRSLITSIGGSIQNLSDSGFSDGYSNVFWIFSVLGEDENADSMVKRTSECAARSKNWRQTVNSLATIADNHLRKGRQSDAWQAVEEMKTAMRRNGSSMAIDRSQIGRLLRHFVYANHGVEKFLEYVRNVPATDYARIANYIELKVFESWVKMDAGIEQGEVEAKHYLTEALRRELPGILARLHAIHVLPASVSTALEGQTSAEIIEELFGPPLGPHGLAPV